MTLAGSRDGDDPRLLREQPGQGNLGRRDIEACGDEGESVDEGLVGSQGLGSEAGEAGPDVGGVEGGIRGDPAGQIALP